MRFLKVLLLLAISVGFPSRGQSSCCDQGWLKFGGNCFFFNHDGGGRATWDEASKACQALGGRLADIRNEAEWEFVKLFLRPSTQYMIGITDKASEGHWKYIDGGHVSFIKWAPHQPDSGTGENCGSLLSDSGLYNDFPCSTNRVGVFICKKSAK